MKRVEDVINQYDPSEKTDRKKIRIIEWFQKHPGNRFDITEVHQDLGHELEIGRGRMGQILKELDEKDSVLESHGNQRKAYQLSEDILVPIKYQAISGFRHLKTIVDISRWGITGFLVIATVIWSFLTFPFWFLSFLLLISPSNRIGPLTESELIVLALSMTIWLLIFVLATSALHIIRRRLKGLC